MRIALLYHPWNLSFRGKWTWDDLYNDPRGMSGSELGFVEIGKALARAGHSVFLYSDSATVHLENNLRVFPWEKLQSAASGMTELAIAINHPGGLEHFGCPRVCIQWVNSFEYLSRAEMANVDLWLSPSEPHQRMIIGQEHRLTDGTYTPDPEQWKVVPLGCTPELYEGIEKVPGRVIYASSPDRGLHHLLHMWPSIKRQVPHAELRIYYRLRPWIAELKHTPPWEPIEENRQRALFIEAALERLKDPKWGVVEHGPVSRNEITRAMGEAEVLAYPCDTLRWSEGFSCTTLEACAAGAVPVIWDCDALGEVYRDSGAIICERGDEEDFAGWVRGAMTLSFVENNRQAMRKFAKEHTWERVAKQLLETTTGLKRPAVSSSSASSQSVTVAAASET